MRRELPSGGIEFVEIPRAEINGRPISASRVRALIKEGGIESARELIPRSTYEYFLSDRGREAIGKIREAGSVAHY
jgi:[citrate (pro-3S)-lyase] ligase